MGFQPEKYIDTLKSLLPVGYRPIAYKKVIKMSERPSLSENTVRRFCLTEDTILKYLFLDSKNEDNGATSSEWVGMIFLKRRYSSEREEEFFFSCESGCEGEIENPKLLVFGGNKYYGQDDMARVIALQ